MKIEHVELMRGYRFGPRNNGVADFTRFTVGQRGVEAIERDELGWIRIDGDPLGPLLVPPQHVDFARPAADQENWRREAGKRGAAARWSKPPEKESA